MSEHIPGPWRVDFDEATVVRETHKNGRVCALHQLQAGNWGRRDPEEVAATARLIAAAPDLLAALQALYERSGASRDISNERDQAERAIARATLPERGGPANG